jgi:hypothetical protein
MVLVSANLALGIFLVILTVGAIAAHHFSNYDSFDKHWFHTFVAVVSGLGVFVTFLFYYNVVGLQHEGQKLQTIEQVSHFSDLMVNGYLAAVRRAIEVVPQFIYSLHPLVTPPDLPPDPDTPIAWAERSAVCYQIFSLWQEAVTSHRYLTEQLGETPFLTQFLHRCRSSWLREEWDRVKYMFSPTTQALGALLFRYSATVTEQTPTAYAAAAVLLEQDPEFRKLF